MKYPMKNKTDRPLFEYLVRDNMKMDYYLFAEFDAALKQAERMSVSDGRYILIYETYFNIKTREWRGCYTFSVMDGEVTYDKHAKVELHLEFYVNAGEWLNPNEEWIELLGTDPLQRRQTNRE